MDERRPNDSSTQEAGLAAKSALGSGASDRRELEEAFAPWRASVHRHLVFRAALDGLTVGAVTGLTFAAGAVLTHHHPWRVGGVAFAAAGAIVGAWRGARSGWGDDRIALFVDGGVGSPQTGARGILLGPQAPAGGVEKAGRPPPFF